MNPRLTAVAGLATVLTSMALYPLFLGVQWFWAGAGAVVVAGLVGTLTRLRAVPAVLCFAAALAGEFLYLNAVFAGGLSFGGLVPTTASVHHLGVLVTQARREMARYAPAVPDRPGVMLLATAGIGLIAAATDLLAVRLRRPAIAGLPLLVLYCVPLTTFARAGWADGTIVFCLSVAGYLALLSADSRERLRLWGRLVHHWHGEPERRGPDTRPLTAAGRRIGLTAVVIAIFLPLLVPGLREHRLFSGSGGGGGGYPGQISLPNPVDQLNRQLHLRRAQVVFSYRTPSGLPPYFQIYVLSQLTDKAFSMLEPKLTQPLGKGNLPAVPGLAAGTLGTRVRETITLSSRLSSGNVSNLPLPYAARTVRVPSGDWRVDPATLTLLDQGTPLAGLRYTVSSYDVEPSRQQLLHAPAPPAGMGGFLYVPPDLKVLTHLAHKIVKGRTTAFGEALALQDWFVKPGRFTYSLTVPQAASSADLIDFLEHSRTGYCQQFAFAYAVLARLLGIPSRVVVGYTQGSFFNGSWLVKTSDAHAWPELYFAGAGWIRFEPTPGGGLGHTGQATAIPPIYTVASATGPGGAPNLPPTRGAGPSGYKTPSGSGHAPQISRLQRGFSTAGGRSGHRHGSSAPIEVAVLVVLAALLLAPRAGRSLTRRVRWWRATGEVERAHAAWREIRDSLTDFRFECRASESPRALAGRVARTLRLSGEQRQALDRVAAAEERAVYAATPLAAGTLARDATVARRAVAQACGLQARWSAALMPLSALAPARAGLQHALDVFGWLDVVTGKLRRREHPAVS